MKQRVRNRRRKGLDVLRYARVSVRLRRVSLLQRWSMLMKGMDDDDYYSERSSDTEEESSETGSDSSESLLSGYEFDGELLDLPLAPDVWKPISISLSVQKYPCQDYRNCKHCFFSSFDKETSIKSLRLGASLGRECCITILDAIETWECCPGLKANSPGDSSFFCREADSFRCHFSVDSSISGRFSIFLITLYKIGTTLHTELQLFQPQGTLPSLMFKQLPIGIP